MDKILKEKKQTKIENNEKETRDSIIRFLKNLYQPTLDMLDNY